MATLYWLKTIQPCKLELRPLTDYAGQPLIFTTPGTSFSRRCVTEEVRNSETVQLYIKRQMIADDSVIDTQPARVAPVVSKAAPKPTPAPTPVPVPTAPPPAPVAVVVEMVDQVPVAEVPVEVTPVEPVVEPVVESVVETTAPTEDDSNDTRRNKRGRNR